jgi:MFS transporter, MHS family, metabolite:H+ symporter
LGFAVRPVGGVFFGILGDKLGRIFVLLSTVLIMGLASTLIGVLPTYATAGVWAPVLLILLRLLQGFGAGAEQAGASVLMTEYAPRDSRGFLASLPFTGIMLGTVAAALVYFLVLARIENVAETWLWRFPFLLSVVIIAVAIWMRLSLKESPEFVMLEARKKITERPLANLLRTPSEMFFSSSACKWRRTADPRSTRPSQ